MKRSIVLCHFARQRRCYIVQHEPMEPGFTPLFDGKTLDGWQGGKDGYVVQDESIVSQPKGSGNLATVKEYGDFHLKFEFKLTPGANNGIGIRVPTEVEGERLDPAFKGMEIAGDRRYVGRATRTSRNGSTTARSMASWRPRRASSSRRASGTAKRSLPTASTSPSFSTARRSSMPTSKRPAKTARLDGKDHPGLKRDSGHICFCGHGAEVWFRNLRIKELK